MIEVYWGCLIGGIVFSIVMLVAGDLFHHGLDHIGHGVGGDHFDFLNPTTIVGAITSFGGAGILLTKYTSLEPVASGVFAASSAIVLAVGLHFAYIRPMRRGENSVAFSMQDFPGLIGSVTIPIPARGYGEVLIRIGAGNTNQIAASFDGLPLRAGQHVVVIEVRDDTLYVASFDDGGDIKKRLPERPTALAE